MTTPQPQNRRLVATSEASRTTCSIRGSSSNTRAISSALRSSSASCSACSCGARAARSSKRAQVVEESKKVSDVVKMQIKDDPIYGDNPELMKSFNESAVDSDNKVAAQQQKVATQQRVMLGSVVGGLSLLVLLIGLIGIYITHKIAGPIYKMKTLLKQVGQRQAEFPRGGLRKGDELQHFFEAFQQMVDALKDRQAKEIETLEAGIASAKTAGATDESLAKILNVRDAMSLSPKSDSRSRVA